MNNKYLVAGEITKMIMSVLISFFLFPEYPQASIILFAVLIFSSTLISGRFFLTTISSSLGTSIIIALFFYGLSIPEITALFLGFGVGVNIAAAIAIIEIKNKEEGSW